MPARKDEDGILPFSCSTNASNDVLEHLRRVKLGSAAMEFCLYMHRRTFGDAGYHRRKGRQETACMFDLAHWAAEIPNDKSNVRRIRADLEACRILTFTDDPTAPGRGLIAWNTNYQEWALYDKRRLPKRATQPKQPNVVISPEPISNITTLASYKTTMLTSSKQLCSPGENGGNITTPGCLESAGEAARDGSLRKVTKESTEEIDANASSAACADAVTPVPSADHSEPASEHVPQTADVQNPPGGARSPRKRAVSRQRKLTDEQYAAHQAEQGWCAEVLSELCRRLKVKEPPRPGQQKAAAKWFYQELLGVEDGQKRLWQCYDVTKRDPFWQHRTLLLSDLIRPFPEYRSDPAGYRQTIENLNKPKASYAARAAHAAQPARTVRSASDVSPWK